MDEPSTPVRKQLFVHSPPPLGVGAVSATPRQRQLGAAISAFLNSPAVTPPNAPGSWANPHLEPQPEPERPPPPPPSVRLDLSAGTNYAAAPAPLAGLAGAGVLLRLAADSLSADPAEIHAAPLAVTQWSVLSRPAPLASARRRVGPCGAKRAHVRDESDHAPPGLCSFASGRTTSTKIYWVGTGR